MTRTESRALREASEEMKMKNIKCETCIWHDDYDEKNELWAGKVYCCLLDEDVQTDNRCAEWLNGRGEDASAFLKRQYNEERNREALNLSEQKKKEKDNGNNTTIDTEKGAMDE